ncbi:Ger(x)C family spore germination protein [Neobacillus niacini]|uniref:Ger(x)C family spore germination protein n=1 Tax=Neobacillus niacini TaxID=86668 RepID=UPI0039834A8E
MKKASMVIFILLLLTGCWDQMQLRDLKLVDMASIDLDEESGNIVLQYIVTSLNGAGQGGGKSSSEITELKGPSLVEAVYESENVGRGPFLGVNTRIYAISKSFASHDPISKLNFILTAPYSAINSPVVVVDGNISKNLKMTVKNKKEFTNQLYEFVSSLEKNGIMSNVSLMKFIQSKKDPLEDLALPLLKQSNSDLELNGALLFRQGTNTGEKLDKEQVRLVMLLLGRDQGKQRLTGHMSENEEGRIYSVYVKKSDSKITVHPEKNGMPKVNVKVRLKLIVFEAGEQVQWLNAEQTKRLEKQLSKHLEDQAAETIETLQKANCDLLGIGKQLKAYHPNIWKSLKWRKDYPRLSIKPNFDVKILNPDTE